MKSLREQLGCFVGSFGVRESGIPGYVLDDGDSFLRGIKRSLDSADDLQLKIRGADVLVITKAMQEITVDYAEELAHLREFRRLQRVRNASHRN